MCIGQDDESKRAHRRGKDELLKNFLVIFILCGTIKEIRMTHEREGESHGRRASIMHDENRTGCLWLLAGVMDVTRAFCAYLPDRL